MWQAVCSAASNAWTYAAPVLGNLAVKGARMLGSLISGNDSEQDLATLKSEENELRRKIETCETELKTKRRRFSEEQQYLDAEKKSILREHEILKNAEAGLENPKKVGTRDHHDTERHVAKMRKSLFEKREKYEQNEKILREKQEEANREYAEHRKKLEEAYEKIQQDQSEIIHLLMTQPVIQKAKELQALTDTFMHISKLFGEYPDVMVKKTAKMQSAYCLKLMEVKNIMREGHFFPGSLQIWADAALLDLYMLGYLTIEGRYGPSTVRTAKELYQGYWIQLKEAHTQHRPVTEGSDKLQAIEHLLVTQFENLDSLMTKSMSSGASPRALGPPQVDVFHSSSNRAFGAAGEFDRSHSRRDSGSVRTGGTCRRPSAPMLVRPGGLGSSRNEDKILILEKKLAALRMKMGGSYDCQESDPWLWSEQHKPSRSSSRNLAVFPSASGSAYYRGGEFDSDPQREQQYSQNPQEYGSGSNHSINERQSQQIRRKTSDNEHHHDYQGSRYPSLDQHQYHEGQHISWGKHGDRRMHDQAGSEQESQKTIEGRNARSRQQSSMKKFQTRYHSPEGSDSSNDDQC